MADEDRLALPPSFDDFAVGLMLHDPETGAILAANERAEELFGYSKAELRTMAVGDFSSPSSRFTQAEAQRRVEAAARDEPQHFEWQIERASGELRWVTVDLAPTTVDGTDVVCAEVRDVTDFRETERRMRLLSRLVRHNLRNRMTVLLGHVADVHRAVDDEAVAAELESVTEIATEVGNMSDSVRQLQEIIDDRDEGSTVDLSRIVRGVVADVREAHPGADLELTATDGCWVSSDRGIEYALDHAVENAIEHNDRETPTVSVTVEVPDPDRVEVEVADDGPKIPEMETAVLDVDVDADSTFHGTGVGLWVMQWCVDALGGDLHFGANEPRGNVVTFSLPREGPPNADA